MAGPRSLSEEHLVAVDELCRLEEQNSRAELAGVERARWRELTERLFGGAADERRRFFRVETRRAASVEAGERESFDAEVTSLSAGGLFLSTAVASPELVGRELDVTVQFPRIGTQTQRFRVQVCWAAPAGSSANPGVGVRFVELDSAQRRFILEHLRAHLVAMIELSREKYHFFFQHSSDVALLLDHEGRVLEASLPSEVFLGRATGALAGRPAEELVLGDAAELRAALARARARERVRLTLQLRDCEGRALPVEAQLTPFHVRDLRIGTMLVARDLRPQRQLEEQQRALERQAFHADKLATIGQITASIAHDINNPLAYVLTNLALLEEYVAPLEALIARARGDSVFPQRPLGREDRNPGCGVEPELLRSLEGDLADLVHECAQGCSRIRDIMLELKDFSRLDGQAESRVDINAALESALRIVGNLVHHRARLERDLGPALPVSYLNVGRVSQIFLNLLTNATQAFDGPNTGQNVIRVSTRLVEDRIRVQVCDSGRGIPPEIRELVFKPFFTTRREQGGTGLGLSIVRECVQALGGEIELESEVGRGTCVTVCLPVRASRAGLPAVRPAAAGAPRRRVLIVDDDARLLRALERALEREFEVTTTVSPGRALELIRARPFDAILCDVMIPSEMSGPELARRACAERPELGRKFVFMTGGTFDPDEEVALARCDQVVIAKPLDFKALIAVLGSC